MGLSREEATRLKDRLAADFMNAARCFEPGAVNCLAVTNVLIDGKYLKQGANSLSVQVGTKQPVSPEFRKEIEASAEAVLGRKPLPEDLQYTVNPPYRMP